MALIDDPWAIDDLQRRVFQKLFSDQVQEGRQEINRVRRQWLVTLLEGVSHDVPRQIEVAAQQLLATYPSSRHGLDSSYGLLVEYSQPNDQRAQALLASNPLAPPTIPDYRQPQDQVTAAELKEELSQ